MTSTEMKIDKVLGVGSYGKVYSARYGQLPCAVKLPKFDSDDSKKFKFAEEFERECRMLSSLKHPNIVQYLDTWIDLESRRLGLVMELMDESLTNLLKRATGPLPYHIQLNICHDMALALSYLHANAISHRDLSSNNVLLIGEGSRAKVTDFGVSKLMDIDPRLTKLTRDPGTTVYMPPEALLTPPDYSTKLDCFSHGVLTIQIITTKSPDPAEMVHKTVDDPNDPTGCVIQMVLVPECERRKAHIDMVEPNHPLLPVAIDCLRNKEERPAASEICERLAALKKEEKYTLSMKQSRDKNQGLLTQQLQEESQLVKNLKEELQKEKTKFENECKNYQTELAKKDLQIKTHQEQRDQLLEEKRAEHQRELDQLEKRSAELTRELEQRERELDQLKKKRATLESELEQRDQLLRKMRADHHKELIQRDELLKEKRAEHQRELAQKDQFLQEKRAEHDELIKKMRSEHQRTLAERLEKKRAEHQRELEKKRAGHQRELEKKRAEHQRELTRKDELLEKKEPNIKGNLQKKISSLKT